MKAETERTNEMKSLMLLCFATYVGIHGYAPSSREIRSMTGIRQNRLVEKYLRELESEGMIRSDYHPHLQAV